MMEIPILQFVLTKGIGDARIRKLCDIVLTIGKRFGQEGICDKWFLVENFGMSEDRADEVVANVDKARALLRHMRSLKVRMIWMGSDAYPARLASVLGRKAPPVLYVKGCEELLLTSGAGFCGSRHASEKGLSIAAACAKELSAFGITVVSGYAQGVDISAHRSAMINRGKTIFVLAEGILKSRVHPDIEPYINERNALFVSQFPPETPWFAHNAMRRNDLIIALSKAMIVIEAGSKGGSMAAGLSALDLKCPLFVVDYRMPPASAEGNEHLILKGGRPLHSKSDGQVQVRPIMDAIMNEHVRVSPNQLLLSV